MAATRLEWAYVADERIAHLKPTKPGYASLAENGTFRTADICIISTVNWAGTAFELAVHRLLKGLREMAQTL